MAKNYNIWIMVGSIAITGFDKKYYNRGYIIDSFGKIFSNYSKIHLFDITLDEKTSYEESATVIGGGRAAVVKTPHGKIGHTICYDLRFPQLYRSLALEGAEILAVPAAFTKRTGEARIPQPADITSSSILMCTAVFWQMFTSQPTKTM